MTSTTSRMLTLDDTMIPEPGQLCATLFLELTNAEQMRTWLPRLVGIETSIVFILPNGDKVRSMVDEQHGAGLTRTEATAAVHYLRWEFTTAQVESFASGAVQIEIDHPDYLEVVELLDNTRDELLGDLCD